MADSKTIYLAMHDHKHGLDTTAHTTREGAKKWCISVMRETLEDWGPSSLVECSNLSDTELWQAWPEITGETEFFSIEPTQLHESEPDEKENWTADTSHIGA